MEYGTSLVVVSLSSYSTHLLSSFLSSIRLQVFIQNLDLFTKRSRGFHLLYLISSLSLFALVSLIALLSNVLFLLHLCFVLLVAFSF